MKKPNIAILGSNSHIAKGLINNFLKDERFRLHLYTSSPEKAYDFLMTIEKLASNKCIIHEGYNDFLKSSYDVVINCVGVGTMNKLRGNYMSYFTVTEGYDNLAIGYLCNCRPDALYISFSSGAVYGRDCTTPAEENTMNCIRVNHVATEDYYAIARINAEAKHRAFHNLNIVDLRLFSYFSRFIDLTDGYFITDVIDCILKKKVLVTDYTNIVRDYVHPQDLFSVIQKYIETGKINDAFDVCSSKPVEKNEILDYFSSEYGLKYEFSKSLSAASATGSKNIYYSTYGKALKFGYKPEFSSIDTIKQESKYILTKDF